MLGYCSNSPLRCDKARSMEVLNQPDSCCPECHLSLLPAKDISQQLREEERVLLFAVLLIALMLFMSVYIYYSNFV